MSAAKQKIAILGGGVGAMATAFELTDEPAWRDRLEITVYQLGHRLGGKGASGRGPQGRIEEHGLHVWLGFYENSFRMIRKAYSELTPGGSSNPIVDGVFSSWEHAFQKQSWVGVFDHTAAGSFVPWLIRFPEDSSTPGDEVDTPDLWELTIQMIEWMADSARNGALRQLFQSHPARPEPAGLLDELTRIVEELQVGVNLAASSLGLAALDTLANLLRSLPPLPLARGTLVRDQLVALLDALRSWIVQEVGERSPIEHRLLLTLDMGAVIARGLIKEQVFEGKPLSALDDDFRAWLLKHGALPQTGSLETNPLLRALYDFVFAFVGGKTTSLDASGSFETGCAIRTIYRMLLTYHGAIFWKMNAGMGDTIFTPLYKVLERRGVRFEFFSRVEQLNLSPDGYFVDSIEITRQATPRASSYDPLVRVAELDCWPSTPKYAELYEGPQLEAAGVDLESFWTPWRGVEKRLLRRGELFDQVVFGLALGSVPFVCQQLVAAHRPWRDMVEHVLTVRTMGVQWWMKPDLPRLGWAGPSVVTTAFSEPLDTWADMTHLIPREVWNGAAPGSCAYFCGPLLGPEPDPQATDTPALARREVERAVIEMVLRLRTLWPDAFDAAGSFDSSLLIEQFMRANVDPSERYVMSVAHSGKYRLKANATGVANLVLTGDWIDNGFNAGCVEAAVMAGLQAANALRGRDLLAGVIGRELL